MNNNIQNFQILSKLFIKKYSCQYLYTNYSQQFINITKKKEEKQINQTR